MTDTNGDVNGRAAKLRKLDETNAAVEIMHPNEEPMKRCPQALQSALQKLFKLFSMVCLVDELTPNTFFVREFLKILQRADRQRTRPVLKLIPSGLMKSLLKTMSTAEFKYDFILK